MADRINIHAISLSDPNDDSVQMVRCEVWPLPNDPETLTRLARRLMEEARVFCTEAGIANNDWEDITGVGDSRGH